MSCAPAKSALNTAEEKYERTKFRVQNFMHSNKLMRFYTGFRNYTCFKASFDLAQACVPPEERSRSHLLPDEDEFFLMMVKLWKNYPEEELALRSEVSQPTVSRILHKWVKLLATGLRSVPIWPSTEQVLATMPEDVKLMYGSTRVIIDATEMKIEKPSNPTAQSATWSSYPLNLHGYQWMSV